jgi:hypothetical protein
MRRVELFGLWQVSPSFDGEMTGMDRTRCFSG